MRVHALLERWNPHACEIASTRRLFAYDAWHAPPVFDFEYRIGRSVHVLSLGKDIKGGSQKKAAVYQGNCEQTC